MVEKIYQKYFKELSGWCASMTCDRAKAEDLVQEAFLRALDHEELFDTMTGGTVQGMDVPHHKKSLL